MSFSIVSSSLNNGEARYLRRTVGRALNECILELIAVRPVDPVEYMGLWLRHHVDSRKYYANKQGYYQQLISTKLDMENRRRLVMENYNEAVKALNDILNDQNTKDTSLATPTSVENELPQDAETNQEKASAVLLTHPSSKTTFSVVNQKLTRVSSKPTLSIVNQESVNMNGEGASSAKTIESTSSWKKVAKITMAIKAMKAWTRKKGDRQEEDTSNSSTSHRIIERTPESTSWKKVAKVTKAIKTVKAWASKKYDKEEEDKLYSGPNHRTSDLEVFVGTWKFHGGEFKCHHPILGILRMDSLGSRPSVGNEFITKEFIAQSSYDHELYTAASSSIASLSPIELAEKDSKETSLVDLIFLLE